jgi:hypothetical protein
MPVAASLDAGNRAQTARMRALVASLDASALAVRLPNGWTVAGALGHIAFWDRQRLCFLRRLATGVDCHTRYDGELFNETLLPFLEAIPGDRVAAMAVQTAEEIDQFLSTLPDEVIAAALDRPDKPNLDRGSHREYHLDQIDRALAAQRHAERGLAGRQREEAAL